MFDLFLRLGTVRLLVKYRTESSSYQALARPKKNIFSIYFSELSSQLSIRDSVGHLNKYPRMFHSIYFD